MHEYECPCGHSFDAEELGIYGCPNCEGDTVSELVDKQDAAARQARSRKARAEAGGKQVTVFLDKPAHEALKVLTKGGETAKCVICRALVNEAARSNLERVKFRITPEMVERLKKVREQHNITTAEFVRQSLDRALKTIGL